MGKRVYSPWAALSSGRSRGGGALSPGAPQQEPAAGVPFFGPGGKYRRPEAPDPGAPFPGPRCCAGRAGPPPRHPCPRGPPGGGPYEVSSEMSSGNPAPRVSQTPGSVGRSLAFRAREPGRRAVRVKQGRATRRLWLASAPGRIPGGYGGPPMASPALHDGETDEKIKNLCNSSRKVLFLQSLFAKSMIPEIGMQRRRGPPRPSSPAPALRPNLNYCPWDSEPPERQRARESG